MLKAKWLVPVLILGMVAVADAKKNNQNNGGIKGKIVSVSKNYIIIQTGKKNGGQQTTIHTSPNTTVEINKQGNHAVSDLQAGEHVVVQEDQNGVATDIQATGKHKHHKAA